MPNGDILIDGRMFFSGSQPLPAAPSAPAAPPPVERQPVAADDHPPSYDELAAGLTHTSTQPPLPLPPASPLGGQAVAGGEVNVYAPTTVVVIEQQPERLKCLKKTK